MLACDPSILFCTRLLLNGGQTRGVVLHFWCSCFGLSFVLCIIPYRSPLSLFLSQDVKPLPGPRTKALPVRKVPSSLHFSPYCLFFVLSISSPVSSHPTTIPFLWLLLIVVIVFCYGRDNTFPPRNGWRSRVATYIMKASTDVRILTPPAAVDPLDLRFVSLPLLFYFIHRVSHLPT
jgi:hypothetical protein